MSQSDIIQYSTMSKDIEELIRDNNLKIQILTDKINTPQWMNSTQAAKYIGVSPRHLIGRLKDAIGYSKREGKAGNKKDVSILMFNREALDAYMMRNYVHPKN